MSLIIDDIYKSIAQNIVNSVDENWEEAELLVEREANNAIGFKGGTRFNDVFSSFKFRNFDRRQLVKDFHALYEITAEGEVNNWNKAKCILFPSGKFSIDFEWDQDMADELEALSKE